MSINLRPLARAYGGCVAVPSSALPAPPRPLLRGVLHQAGFAVSLVVGKLLIVGADGASRRAAAAVFASSVPVCLLVLDGAWRIVVLAIVYAGAAAAVALKFAWVDAPKWLAAVLGIALGWAGVAILPQLATRLNPAAVALLGVGGLAYTAGAIIYARRRPNPMPTVFGYHELFHALTLVAVACQYVAIAFFIIRAG